MNVALDAGILLTWATVLAIFVGIIAVLFIVASRGTEALLGPRRRLEEELGMEVLQKRLDRGEITREEFEQAKRALGR